MPGDNQVVYAPRVGIERKIGARNGKLVSEITGTHKLNLST